MTARARRWWTTSTPRSNACGLRAQGIPLDHIGGSAEHRRRACVVIEPERLQIELVAYDSALPLERNVYA